MIELAEGLWVNPDHVALVKKIDEDSCLLYTVGQSALDGHVLPYGAGEVAEAINDCFEEGDEDDQDEE